LAANWADALEHRCSATFELVRTNPDEIVFSNRYEVKTNDQIRAGNAMA
jgi:hypothetical protein